MTQQPTAGSGKGLRSRMAPARRRLGLAILMVVLGSFLPWLDTGVGAISGARGPGVWTFYAALVGLAAVFIPARRLAAAQAAIMAAVCLVLPVWQLTVFLQAAGFSGWLPGPGVVLVFGGGVLAAAAAWQLWRENPAG